MEFLMILAISYFITKEVGRDAVDAIALSKGKNAPNAGRRSTRSWTERTGKSAEPGLAHYAGRILNNAVEAWADRSSQRHRRRKLKLAALGAKKDDAWLQRKLRRTEKRAAHAEKFAAKCGVVWDKTKGTAVKAKETIGEFAARQAEKKAHQENTGRDEAHEEAQAWRRNEAYDEANDRATEAEYARAEPGHTGYTHEPPPFSFTGSVPFEPQMPPTVVQAMAERVETESGAQPETGRADTEPLQLPAAAPTHSADTELAVSIPTTSEALRMAFASAEISNLPAAQAYTAAMSDYTAKLQGVVETYQSQLTTLADDLGKEMADGEVAVSSLASAGLTGGPVDALQIANEQLATMKSAVEQAQGQLAPMHDSATAAAGAYANAKAVFDQQVGLAEQAQTQKAQGNLARDTDFYANA